MSKEEIIVAFLRCVAQEYESSPNKNEVYIPYAFQRTLYATFLEFWMEEVYFLLLEPEFSLPNNYLLYHFFSSFWVTENTQVEDGNIYINICPPHESWFHRVWRERVRWLKCRAYHTFMMCDECVSLNDRCVH